MILELHNAQIIRTHLYRIWHFKSMDLFYGIKYLYKFNDNRYG
jgi:hypothetical protein